MAPAMPCKTCKKSKHGETRGKTNDFKSKFACILEVYTVHFTRHLFLVFVRTHNDVSHDIGSSVCARHLIHVSCVCVSDLSSTLSSHSSFVSPIFHFILLNFDFYFFLFHVDVAGARSPVHFAE